MNHKRFRTNRRWLWVAAALLGMGAAAQAAPLYTDKDTALELAQALDKGVFNNNLITATFIQSAGKNRYFIKVVLDNNTSQNWNLDQLQHWSRKDVVRLRGNRALVFPSQETNAFLVLDKSQFVRQALKARVYEKKYKEPDPLVGRVIPFAVHRFNLSRLVGAGGQTDDQGYPYRYVLDLMNGQREFLSYLDAYSILERTGLKEGGEGEAEYRPYHLKAVRSQQPGAQDDRGGRAFALELEFDRTVQLAPDHFPFQLFERGAARKGKGFTLEVTLPNTDVSGRIPPVENLEYLHDIKVVTKPPFVDRAFLQAYITPDVLNQPPVIQVEGSTVKVNFYQVVDQTVRDASAVREADLRLRQKELGGIALSEEDISHMKSYRAAFQEGMTLTQRARDTRDVAASVGLYQQAIQKLLEASANATTDNELADALNERNQVESRLPGLILDHVRRTLRQGGGSSGLQELLDVAKAMTRDSQTHGLIKKYEKQLGGR
ncbi:MAG: hypothetical protein OEW12_05545 [Deltaproteobacteria bacterium]|nr:hypothetical protein [Deltaproteobacteria bacterium]